jgi:hypothetical protein
MPLSDAGGAAAAGWGEVGAPAAGKCIRYCIGCGLWREMSDPLEYVRASSGCCIGIVIC